MNRRAVPALRRLAPCLLRAASACATTSGRVAPTSAAALEAELLQVDRDFAAAAAATDMAAAVGRFFASDGVEFATGEPPVVGIEAVRRSFADLPGVLRWQPRTATAGASGDLGVTTGDFQFEQRGDATHPPKVGHGKYVTVWRRGADGLWKVKIDVGNASPPPAAP